MTDSQSSPSFENIPNLEGISKELICQLPDNSDIWHNLKQAIATSSGFKRWQLEHSVDGKFNSLSLDTLVRSYLRETLETLAY